MIALTFRRKALLVFKLFGLFPIRVDYNSKDKSASFHKIDFVYSTAFAGFFIALVCYSFHIFLSEAEEDIYQDTLLLVLKIEHFCGFAQSILTFSSIFYFRYQIVDCLNLKHRIHGRLQSVIESYHRYDDESNRKVKLFIVWTIIQCIFTVCTWILYVISSAVDILPITIMMFCSNVFTMVVTIMQCLMLSDVAQLYQNINGKLSICVDRIHVISSLPQKCQTKMQMFCDVSDEIDQVASLFRCVSEYRNITCRILSASILANVVNSFAYALIAVVY